MTITIDMVEGSVGNLLRALGKLESGAMIGAAIDVACTEKTKEHLRERNVTHPNKLGGVRTNWWAQAAQSVMSTVTVSGAEAVVEISIPHRGMALRYYGSGGLPGGVVKPTGRISEVTGKPIRFLTIPIHARAHGKEARDFPNLKWYAGKLVEVPEGEKPTAQSVALFALARSTKHEADPTVLPSEKEYGDAADAGMKDAAAGLMPSGWLDFFDHG